MDYQKLAPNEIRLVLLLPGAEYTNIELLSIPHVSLANAPAYKALSYAWGDPEDVQTITVDNVYVKVTKNLASFLWQIRQDLDPGMVLLLWIDAICINQQDIEERNQQLLLMRRIYERAETTIVWLGPGADKVESAVILCATICDKDLSDDDLDRWLEDEENKSVIKESWLALARLMSRPWFFRTWVIQEVVVARAVIVRCGKYSLSLQEIFNTTVILRAKPRISVLHNEIIVEDPKNLASFGEKGMAHTISQLGIQIEAAGRRRSNQESDSLLILLSTYRNSFATDPRDKIYSLLGILETADTHRMKSAEEMGFDPHVLKVDYNTSVEDVYKSAVKAIVTTTQNLDVICASQPQDGSSLPSWTPDWSKPWISESVLKWERHHRMMGYSRTYFQASGKSKAEAMVSDTTNILFAKGMIIDEILDIWPQLLIGKKADYGTNYAAKTRLWREKNSYGVYGSAETAGDAHFRSLIANLAIDTGVPRPAWSETFEKWISGTSAADFPFTVESDDFFNRTKMFMKGRRTAIGKAGYFIALPERAREGDLVVVLFGCSVPVILRSSRDSVHDVKFIGEAYVHGIMGGEAMDGSKAVGGEATDFKLR